MWRDGPRSQAMYCLVVGLPRYALLIGQGRVLAERIMPGYPVVDAVILGFSSQRGAALGREVGFSWLLPGHLWGYPLIRGNPFIAISSPCPTCRHRPGLVELVMSTGVIWRGFILYELSAEA